MRKTIVMMAALLMLSPGISPGQQVVRVKPQPTGKCWKVDMKSEADFYAKGWVKKNGFVGIVLLDGSMKYAKEDRIKQISRVDCTSVEVRD
jgi:hypothetical protein